MLGQTFTIEPILTLGGRTYTPTWGRGLLFYMTRAWVLRDLLALYCWGYAVRGTEGRGWLAPPPIHPPAPETHTKKGARHHRCWPDGWTVVTADGSLAAQFEHTLLITEDGAEVLTKAPPEGAGGAAAGPAAAAAA